MTLPLLYTFRRCPYLKQHQADYCRRLSIIRTEGDWESWVAFFLEGVATEANEAEMTGQKKNRRYSYQPYVELLTR